MTVPKAQEGSEVSLLHLAAEHNDLTLVKNVLEKADSPKQRQQILDILDGDGNTPLLTAAGLLNTDCRNYLIFQGASINIKNYEGQSIYSITLDNAPSGQWSEMEDLLARVTELGIKPRLNHLDIKGRDIHDLDPKYQPLFSDVVPQSTIVLQSTIDRNGARTVNSPLHRVLNKLGYVMEPREAPLSAAQVRNVLQSNSAILDHWEPAILSYVRGLGNRCTFDGDVFALKRFATEARFSHKVHVAACDALRAVLDQVSIQPSWGWSVEHIVTLLANMEDLPADLRRMALSCINR